MTATLTSRVPEYVRLDAQHGLIVDAVLAEGATAERLLEVEAAAR